ncbi:hypothetical protein GCM10020254_70070 [Streptomyces goshikiensis]
MYVEQHPGRAARDGRGRRVRTDAAAGQYGDPQVRGGEELLEEDEGGGPAHPAPGLVPLGDDRPGPGGPRREGLREGGGLGPDPGLPGGVRPGGDPLGGVLARVGQQHRVHLGRQVARPERAAPRHPHPVPAVRAEPPGEFGEGGPGGGGIPAQVEQPEGARPFGGGHDPWLRLFERADRDDEVAGGGGSRGLGGHGRSSE